MNQTQARYADFDEAIAGHREMCEWVGKELVKDPGPWPDAEDEESIPYEDTDDPQNLSTDGEAPSP
ncbi:hypothetical protein [Pseudomonas putida]|uniref:Uncharacterized protein n=1 Tax=Pseudomonas putida TaxID=303 RepID=A0A8I1E9R3_PSEPU|nr:hypothetical protein [Pseudomonas putida]MBI6882405.1 hypothetical protein [Pseudomonas putida]